MGFDRFRLWLSDTRYTQLTKSLQELIQAYVEGRAGEAQESLHAFLTEFAADLIGDSREQVSVEEITGKLIDGIKEHLLAFQYLIDEIRKTSTSRIVFQRATATISQSFQSTTWSKPRPVGEDCLRTALHLFFERSPCSFLPMCILFLLDCCNLLFSFLAFLFAWCSRCFWRIVLFQ